jgi:GR25 family glycosyltransferase involved in LPS biosynthesis
MRTVCVTLHGGYQAHTPGAGPRDGARTRAHFAERGVGAQFFYGVHADKLGVDTTLPYEVDGGAGCGYKMGPARVGCWLSHRTLWAALLLLPDDLFLVVEDDAKFPEDWRPRLERAVADAGHFDMLFVGSCCTQGKPTKRIAGDIYEVKWPSCTHGYVVRRGALETLITTQDEARCYAPIDISLGFHSFSRMSRVYTLLPRLLEQFDTFIPE